MIKQGTKTDGQVLDRESVIFLLSLEIDKSEMNSKKWPRQVFDKNESNVRNYHIVWVYFFYLIIGC